MRTVEQKVHDTAIEYIQQIRNREKQIIDELQNIYGPDCIQQLANKKELLAQVSPSSLHLYILSFSSHHSAQTVLVLVNN